MLKSLQTAAAGATTFVHRVAAQVIVSVAGGVCVAFITNAYIIQNNQPAVTEIAYQAPVAAARADRLPKSEEALPAQPLEPGQMPGISGLSFRPGETLVAKRAPAAPNGDFGDAPPVSDLNTPVAEVAEPGAPIALMPAPTPSSAEPAVLPAMDDDFDATRPPQEPKRASRILSLPFTAIGATVDSVGRGVESIGQVVASIGK